MNCYHYGVVMELEKIVEMWDKDCKIDETELGLESTKIPQVHNKYLKIYMGERITFFKLQSEVKKIRRTLTEYYLGELSREELEELGRDQFYKKLLKNEIDTYIESDNLLIDSLLKMSLQEQKVNYLESVIKSINNRGYNIKNAIEWMRFTTG